MERTFRLADHGGPQLWTREKAREVRATLAAALDRLQPGDALVIDAAGIDVFDYSFANELFGKTVLSLAKEYPGRFLLIEHLTPYAHENLEKALEGIGLQMIERHRRTLGLIGKVHPVDQATFDAINRAKHPSTASSLATTLNANLTAINERLTKLMTLGIVRREKTLSAAGREQYEYRILS